MKTKLLTLLFALLSASGLFAWDYGHVQIGDLYYNLDATTRIAAVTSEIYYGFGGDNYASLSGAVVIPSSVTYYNEQYSVIGIDDYAFNGCTGLTSITIPESVTSIGDYAFYGCTGLTSINIPDKVTRIGYHAFEDCTGLTSIVWNARNYSDGYAFDQIAPQIVSFTLGSNVENIPSNLCSGMSKLTSITIPESVTSIRYNAFEGCTGLTSIVWNVRNYSDNYTYAFNEIAPQIISFTFGNHVETIPDYLCRDMSKLTSITIPENVTSIRSSAFDGCTGLTSIVWNVRNYSDDYTYAFNEIAPQIVSFTLGSNVENIPSNLCSGMSKLTSITIPESVTSLEDWVFYGCSGLTSITIPESVTSIGNGAFSACSGLTSITVAAGNTVYDSHDNCNAIIETATNKLIAGCKNTVIPNSVTSIEYSAFSECLGLTSITIPNSVTYIGEYAFEGCTDLTSVTLGSSLKVIEYMGFAYCENIQTITCYSQRPPTVQESGLVAVPYSTIIYVPADYLDTYKQHVTWGNYDVRPIDGSAVENVTSVLGSMTLTDGVLTLSEPLYMEIYTVSGASVFCGTASSVSLPTPGIYLLRSQGVTQKITVH